MTSTLVKYTKKSHAHGLSTQSFGTHRHSDRPASAIRAGANSMPAAWQTRGFSNQNEHSQYGAPARSIADILADPFRWATATTPRKIALACLATMAILTLIF